MQNILKDVDARMTAAIDTLARELAAVRTGRANAALLEGIRVDYYGTPTPVAQMASVTVPDARTLMVQPWDATQLKAIEKAIIASDLGLTPSNDGKAIRLTLPTPTEEPEPPPRGEREAQGARQGQAGLRGRGAAGTRPDPEGDRQVHREGRRAAEEEGTGNSDVLIQ